jgi:hypothetical protein
MADFWLIFCRTECSYYIIRTKISNTFRKIGADNEPPIRQNMNCDLLVLGSVLVCLLIRGLQCLHWIMHKLKLLLACLILCICNSLRYCAFVNPSSLDGNEIPFEHSSFGPYALYGTLRSSPSLLLRHWRPSFTPLHLVR